jgi:hypothetical protein
MKLGYCGKLFRNTTKEAQAPSLKALEQQYNPSQFYFYFMHELVLYNSAHVLTPFCCCFCQYKDQFHTIINDEELLFFFGMCLFDLIGARNYKALNFSDFTYACLTLSMFGQEELMR